MKEIYRCPNCGHPGKSRQRKCAKCGYVREGSGNRYKLVMQSYSVDKSSIVSVVSAATNKMPMEVRLKLDRLPSVIDEGLTYEEAKETAYHISQAGAEVIIMSEEERLEVSDHAELQGMEPARNALMRLLPLIFVAIVVFVPLIADNFERIKEEISPILEELGIDTGGEFDYVEIVVARENIQAGTELTLDILGKAEIPFERAPEGGVAPLNVRSLLGKKALKGIPRGLPVLRSYFDASE